MKVALLFSGGKDSTYAGFLASKKYKLVCLVTLFSENSASYMFHTSLIEKTQEQASLMDMPLIRHRTKGEKEMELIDLKEAIVKAKEKFKIKGVVTGALKSDYQASRILKICDELGIKCINPLWQKDQIELLEELVKNKFEIIITAVAAYPFDKSWIGRKIDRKFIEEIRILEKKYGINPAGEGGEFETLVLNCPMFNGRLKLEGFKIEGEGNCFFIKED